MVIFCFSYKKVLIKRRQDDLTKKKIKKQLLDSIAHNDLTETETENLNQKVDKVEKLEDAADVIKAYEDIHTHTKKIISIAYHQGKVFKRLKDKEKFIRLVKEFKVHKSTIIFKTNIFELIDKHPKLIKSSTKFCFLKNYYKDIKEICKENSSAFE